MSCTRESEGRREGKRVKGGEGGREKDVCKLDVDVATCISQRKHASSNEHIPCCQQGSSFL